MNSIPSFPKYLVVLSAILFLFFSCKKKNDAEDSNTTPKRNIAYFDFVPDIVVQMPPTYTHYIEQYIDIDNDSISDFMVYLKHSAEYNGPHAYDSYFGQFRVVDSVFLLSRGWGLCNTPFDSLDYISDRYGEDSFIFLTSLPVTGFNCCSVYQSHYIGFYLIKNKNKYCGWFRTSYGQYTDHCLRIFDCAINKTPNDSIQAGER